MKTLLLYAANWCALLIIAILNGALRAKVFAPRMADIRAHQLSTLVGLCLFSIYMWFLTGVTPIRSGRLALLIGGIWLAMTIAFEFLFGHFIVGHSWRHLLHDYNLLAGRLWVLVPVWTAVAPYVFYRVRSSKGRHGRCCQHRLK